eukprot:jgi/Chlat1/8971/Chrsp94S08334
MGAAKVSTVSRVVAWSVVAAVLVLRHGVYGETVVHSFAVPAPMVSFAKELREPRYRVNINGPSPFPSDLEQEDETRVQMIMDSQGRQFRCTLPEPPQPSSHDSMSEADGTSTPSNRSPETLLQDLQSSAPSYRVEGWWTYELKFKTYLKQYHQEKDQMTAEYILGVYDEAATRRHHMEKGKEYSHEQPAGEPQRYHSHIYTNGTKCDVAPYDLRETEHSSSFIFSIKEPLSCKYVLTYFTPVLCKHEEFRLEEQPIQHINCYLAEADDSANRQLEESQAEPTAEPADGVSAVEEEGSHHDVISFHQPDSEDAVESAVVEEEADPEEEGYPIEVDIIDEDLAEEQQPARGRTLHRTQGLALLERGAVVAVGSGWSPLYMSAPTLEEDAALAGVA